MAGSEQAGPADGPLTGVDVVDLTQMLAGPYATMLLADLGANVVKVESPRGDLTRTKPPHLGDEEYDGYFASVNRNKRGIVLDLKSEDGRAALESLAAEADVLVENYRVGTMEKLGLPYEDLREKTPDSSTLRSGATAIRERKRVLTPTDRRSTSWLRRWAGS